MSFESEYNFAGDLGEMDSSLANIAKSFGEFEVRVNELAGAYEEYLAVDSDGDISVVQSRQAELLDGFLNYANGIASEGFEDRDFSRGALTSSMVLVEAVHARIINENKSTVKAHAKDLELELEMDETPLDELSKVIADQVAIDVAVGDKRANVAAGLSEDIYSTGENLASFLAARFERFNGIIEKVASAKKENLNISIDMLDPLVSRELVLKKIDSRMTLAYIDYIKTGHKTSVVAYRSARRQIKGKFIDYVNYVVDAGVGANYSRKTKIKTIANFIADIDFLHRDALRGCLTEHSALKPEFELSKKENAEIRKEIRNAVKGTYDFEMPEEVEKAIDYDEDKVGIAEIGDSIFSILEDMFERDDDWIDDLRIENSQLRERLRRAAERLGVIAVAEACSLRVKRNLKRRG